MKNNCRKTLSVLLSAVLLLTGLSIGFVGLPTETFADTWDGSWDGSGFSNNHITSAKGFAQFINNAGTGTSYSGQTVYLDVDIDLNNIDFGNISGGKNVYYSKDNYFQGTFDGQGHTIANFRMHNSDHRVALFRSARNATFKNVTFTNVLIDDNENNNKRNGFAVLVGYGDGNLTFENVHISGGYVYGYNYVGGLVGEYGANDTLRITNCSNGALIHADNDRAAGLVGHSKGRVIASGCSNTGEIYAAYSDAGGIAGWIEDDESSFTNCSNTGKVSADACAGGIFGYFGSKSNDNKMTITGCSNTEYIESRAKVGGGIAGMMDTDGAHSIENNTNRGTVYGRDDAGGIVGSNIGSGVWRNNKNYGSVSCTNDNAGGILGEVEDDQNKFYNCYNTGDIVGKNSIGGIFGYGQNANHEFYDCGNSGAITSTSDAAGGIFGYGNESEPTIEQCWNIGTVNAYNDAGGILGRTYHHSYIRRCWNAGAIGTYNHNDNGAHGGIAGQTSDKSGSSNSNPNMTDCYNWGPISGGRDDGGLIGKIKDGRTPYYITNSYNAGQVTGTRPFAIIAYGGNVGNNVYYDNGIAMGTVQGNSISDADLKASSGFSGNYCQNTWGVKIGGTTYYYPILQWYRNMFQFRSNFVDGSTGTNAYFDGKYDSQFYAPNPLRTGYTSGNWVDENDASHIMEKGALITNGVTAPTNVLVVTQSFTELTEIKNTTTYHLNWTANSYTIKYDSNGGEGTVSDSGATYDQNVTLRGNAFTKHGPAISFNGNGGTSHSFMYIPCVFCGWGLTRYADDTVWEKTGKRTPGDTQDIYEDIHQETISGPYANGDVYFLEFDAKGTGEISTYFYGAPTIRQAETLTGQTSSSSDGRVDQTLTSEYKHYGVLYTVGVNSSADKYLLFRVYDTNDHVEYKNVRFYKVYNAGSAYKNLAPSGSVTLYAVWTYGTIDLPTSERPGFRFKGWSETQTDGAIVNDPYTTDADRTLYAQWETALYTITYKDGSETIDTQTYTFVDSVTLRSAPTKDGYEFLQWILTTPDGNWSHNYNAGSSAGNSQYGDPVFTASWKLKDLTAFVRDSRKVSIPCEAGTVSGVAKQTGSGSFSRSGNTILYTAGKTLNGVETAKFTVGSYEATVTIIPAAVVYYDDSSTYDENNNPTGFFHYSDSPAWWTTGTADNSVQTLFKQGDIFGSDDTTGIFFGGAAQVATVGMSNALQSDPEHAYDNCPHVTFTFTGTAFEVISAVDSEAATVAYTIQGTSEGADYSTAKRFVVDTYMGYTYDAQLKQWNSTGNATTSYRIPVIRKELTYGTYKVTVAAFWNSYYVRSHPSSNPNGTFRFIFDGVRIWDPANAVSAESGAIYNAYKGVGQSDWTEKTLRDAITEITTEDGNPAKVLIEGVERDYATYRNACPKNEILLAKNGSISIKLNGNASKVWLSAACVSGNNGTTATFNSKTVSFTYGTQYVDLIAVKTADGIVTITNTGDGILSLRNIRFVGSSTVEIVTNPPTTNTGRISLFMKAHAADEEFHVLAPFTDEELAAHLEALANPEPATEPTTVEQPTEPTTTEQPTEPAVEPTEPTTAEQPTEQPTAPAEPVTQPNSDGVICGYCGKSHPRTFLGSLIRLIHAVLYFFRTVFGLAK